MEPHAKSALALALAIVGGIAAGMRCDASEWVENSSQINPRGAYTVKAYTVADPFDAMDKQNKYDSETEHGTIPDKQDEWNKKYE